MRFVILFATPAIIVLLSIPLLLGRIPPNHWYGFRTPKTLSSPTVWYPANRFAGRLFIFAGAAAILINLVLMQLLSAWSDPKLLPVMVMVMPACLVAALLMSFVHLRRL